MTPLEGFTGIVAAGLSLMVWSILYRPNSLFRMCENVYVGAATGFSVVVGLKEIWSRGILQASGQNPLPAVAVVVGLLMYARFAQRGWRWLARLPLAVLLGVGFGASIRAVIQAQIIEQIRDTMRPLVTGTALGSINNIIIVVGTLCTLFYFFYSVEHTGVFQYPSRIGRAIMMMAFGASFGMIFQGRIVTLSSPMMAVVRYPGSYLIPIGLIVLFYAIWRDSKKACK